MNLVAEAQAREGAPGSMLSRLHAEGAALWRPELSERSRDVLREAGFVLGQAGTRCLLDVPVVRQASGALGQHLIAAGILTPDAVAIQAIAFDKSSDANWKVPWHQDLMFPLAGRPSAEGYFASCLKDGVNFARLPCGVLEALLAVRLHLDDCDAQNGPLRVALGTHDSGILASADIAGRVEIAGQRACLAAEGEVWLMRPLLLHASSAAAQPRRRRVLHIVFHSGAQVAERWHRQIRPLAALG